MDRKNIYCCDVKGQDLETLVVGIPATGKTSTLIGIPATGNTPTLDRMLEIQEQSNLCGEFLDWVLRKYTLFDRTQERESPFADVMGAGDYINKEKLLAEFFNIDLEEAEKERQALLDSM